MGINDIAEEHIVYNGLELTPISQSTTVAVDFNSYISNIFGHSSDSPVSSNTKVGYYIHAAILFNRILTTDETIRLHSLMAEI